jgi:hypothetical protein
LFKNLIKFLNTKNFQCIFSTKQLEINCTLQTIYQPSCGSVIIHAYCPGPCSVALERMWKLRCGWWQREGNISTIQNGSIDRVHLCSSCKVCMLISFRICQALPNRNVIHQGQILSTSQSTGCRLPASHRRGMFSGWILVAYIG